MQNSLQDRLQQAVECFLSGQFDPDTMLQAVDTEINTVDSMQRACSQSELGIAYAEALDLYLDCLYQLEELIQAGGSELNFQLEWILNQAGEANQMLDELAEPAEEIEPLVLGTL
ncbi:hypothetical protein JST97_24640 [bacterium]|nr:hypothetical protein [bacterium]